MKDNKNLIKVIAVFATGTFAILTIGLSIMFLTKTISSVIPSMITSLFTIVCLVIYLNSSEKNNK